MSAPLLLTIPQVAESLGVCENTVYKLVRKGLLPVVQVTPGRAKSRIDADDLRKFIEAHKRSAA